jgi:DNA uptake protein ComE-like DNA-binding protein
MRFDLDNLVRVTLAAVIIGASVGCVSRDQNANAQSQQSKDDQTRQEVADATQKAKEDGKVVAKNLDQAAHQAAHDAKVAAQGAKEGGNRGDTGPVNLNAASKEQLETLPGLTAQESDAVINGRPYNTKHDLVTKGIISEDEYDRIADRLAVQ